MPGESDYSRPLNDRGMQDAKEMAGRMLLRNEAINLFLSSPALRARQTCEAFCKLYHYPLSSILWEEKLYHARLETFYRIMEKIPGNYHSLALFSHNPGITDFVNSLQAGARIDDMPACGIFGVQIQADHWSDLRVAEKKFLFFDYPERAL